MATILPESLTFVITSVVHSDTGYTCVTFGEQFSAGLYNAQYQFIQDSLVEDGIAVQPYGAVFIPDDKMPEDDETIDIVLKVADEEWTGELGVPVVGDTISFSPSNNE